MRKSTMPLTKEALACLTEMAASENVGEHEEAEIVRDGRTCWLGDRRIAQKTLTELLYYVAVSNRSDGLRCEHYGINSIGRKILENPELADEIRSRLFAPKADIDEDTAEPPYQTDQKSITIT
jgi:hypothetical protein